MERVSATASETACLCTVKEIWPVFD